MIPRDLHFAAFHNVWQLFWLIPILGLFLYTFFLKKKDEDLLIQDALRHSVILGQNTTFKAAKVAFFSFGWVFAVLALIEPIGNEYYPSQYPHVREKKASLDLLFLIDVSQSMAVPDGRNKKMRLEIAQEIADSLISKLKVDPIAIFAFTSELAPIVPLTYDRTFSRLSLRDIQFNEENHFGTNYIETFKQLKQQIAENYPKAPKAILLFSDGGDTFIESLQADSKQAAFEALLKEAENLKAPIFSIGIGSKEGGDVPDVQLKGKNVVSRLDETILLGLSERTGGKYFSAENQTPEETAEKISRSLESVRSAGGVALSSSGVFHQYFQVPLLLSFLLFFLYWLSPHFGKFLIPMLLFSVYGFTANPGESFYDSGKYKEASSWYFDELKTLPPEWLRNKLLYDWATSLIAENKWKEAEIPFFAISKEAYSYPLFRLRLIYNQVLLLILEAEKSPNKVLLLENALDLLQLVSQEKCEGCPEELLADLKDDLKIRLTQASEEVKTKVEDPILALDAKIRLLHLAARLPNRQEGANDHDAELLEQAKLKQANSPSSYLRALIEELGIVSSLGIGVSDSAAQGKNFYSFVFNWQKQEFQKGKCQCYPWKKVLPLFTEGLKTLTLDPFEGQAFYAYLKWIEALMLLEEGQDSDKSERDQPQDEDIQELREMQALDKSPGKAKMKTIGEGMPW